MENNELMQILDQMEIHPIRTVTQFRNHEDGEAYQVWRIDTPESSFVLKQAKAYERETYEAFFSQPTSHGPQCLKCVTWDGKDYLLLSFVPGHDLMHCTREDLTRTLDSLADMQTQWWGNQEKADVGQSFQRSLEGRRNRLKYLHDPMLEAVYQDYLEAYCAMPRTLCHDDLLPFNVLVSDKGAVFIDWEYGGILPYLTSIARLIAHGSEDEEAFFWMSHEDKQFAKEYYFKKCVKPMGISRELYEKHLDLFLFYEYCEWIYVGNKFGDMDNDRFRKYLNMAKEMAIKLGHLSGK